MFTAPARLLSTIEKNEESDMVDEEGMGFLDVIKNFEMEHLINAARSAGFAECA
ncbi:hypothetical protein ACNKHP_00110 [Shigella boydii]